MPAASSSKEASRGGENGGGNGLNVFALPLIDKRCKFRRRACLIGQRKRVESSELDVSKGT